MSQPIHCPKCKGSGKLRKLWGTPRNIEPFSKEYNNIMRHVVPNYEDYEILGLEGATSIVRCTLCLGSGVVFVSPAVVNRGR